MHKHNNALFQVIERDKFLIQHEQEKEFELVYWLQKQENEEK